MATASSPITNGTPRTLDHGNGYSTEIPSVELLISAMSNSSSSTGNPTDTPYTETSYPYTTEDLIILIGTPLIFIPGIIGNTLSAVVMKRPHFRSLSAGAHLFCLALVDSIFLSVNSMTKNFIRLLTNVDLTKTSDWSCKIYVFLLMTSKFLSAWLIVAVTVERLIVVCLPHRAKVLATRRRAWLAILCITLVSCALHVIVLVTYGLVDRPWGSDCTMMLYYRDMGLRLVLTIIDLTTYCLIPSVVLFVSNVILIYKVMRSHSFRQRSLAGTSTTPGVTSQPVDEVTRLTVTLVTVSVAFLISTLPNSLMFLLKTVDDNITRNIPNYDLLYRGLYLLQLSNSAVNFLLYCLSGPAFRRELGRLCSSCNPGSRDLMRNSTKRDVPPKAKKSLGMDSNVRSSKDSVSTTTSAAVSETVSSRM